MKVCCEGELKKLHYKVIRLHLAASLIRSDPATTPRTLMLRKYGATANPANKPPKPQNDVITRMILFNPQKTRSIALSTFTSHRRQTNKQVHFCTANVAKASDHAK